MKLLKLIKKKCRPRILLLVVLWLTASAFGYSQDQTISGTISDDSGQPLAGANILVKGTTNGTQTDFDGNYTINAASDATLVFSYLGFTTQEVVVNGQSSINISLAEDASQLEEVVVVGYGTQKISDLTGSVSVVGSEEIEKYTYNDAAEALQGRTAGVRIEANGGAPGANALVTIRGSSTLSDVGPLYVIDGVLTGSMSTLNPADIESISVLKDASASAIYGSRAANGVIIVTTKRGRKGGLSVDLDMNYGTQKAVNLIGWATAREYADIVNRANDNDGVPRVAANDTEFNPNNTSDIQRESLQSAAIRNVNFRIAGGSENATYSLSASNFNQEGIVKESGNERNTVRTFITFEKGKFKLENSIGLTRQVTNVNPYFNKERDLLPTIRLYKDDGSFGGTDIPEGGPPFGVFYGVGTMRNSLGMATLEDRTVKRNSILGNVAGSFEIINGLTYKLNLGLESFSDNNYRFRPTYAFHPASEGIQEFNELDERNTNFFSTLIEHTLNYKKEFGKHSIDLLGGYTDQVANTRSLGSIARNTPSNDIRVASAAADLIQAPSEDLTKGIRSYFGRLNYVFDSRYLLTATVRRDGSSLFKEDLRWGTFPSIALGWNISNESFMENVTSISNIKLRASYGELGSDNVDIYAFSPEINVNSEYITGSGNQGRQTGFSITKGINSNITWETTKTTDIGLEFSTLDDKLRVTMEYFKRQSEDVLVELGVPRYFGFDNRVPFNTASIDNSGFEFLASYSNTVGDDFSYSVTGNFSHIENVVTALGDATPIIEGQFTSNGLRSTKTDIGDPVGAFFGYVTDGIYQTDAEALAANDSNNPQAGDLKFKDIDGDGDIDSDDQKYLGNPAPKINYGLNFSAQYKNFDLSLFFNGVGASKILNGTIYRGYFDTEGNYLSNALNAWTPQNTGSTIPRNTRQDPGFNRRMSDFYLEDGDYFRLRNMQVGYSFSPTIIKQISASKIRLYASAQNLFTITNYTGYYPEVGQNTRGGTRLFNSGVDEGSYPVARTFQLGVQVSF